jgi:hypothetical protein
LLELCERLKAWRELGLIGEEDGDAVLDGVTEAPYRGDEPVAFEAELAAGDGADEEGEELGRHGGSGEKTVSGYRSVGVSGLQESTTPIPPYSDTPTLPGN